MCRWNAYSGQPILVAELLYRTEHGLVDQARQANEGIELLNGDGFGIGWYDETPEPGSLTTTLHRFRLATLKIAGAHHRRCRHRCHLVDCGQERKRQVRATGAMG